MMTCTWCANAIRRGARGYLTKNVDREELIDAIRKVASGKRHLADELIEQILDQPQSSTLWQAPQPHHLNHTLLPAAN